MRSKRARIDRFLCQQLSISRRQAQWIIAEGRVCIDANVVDSIQQMVDQFSHVTFDGHVLQSQKPYYIQLNKPAGVVSATKDSLHTTALDLLPDNYPDDLHIAGRLDVNSTGLLLISNDGRWTKRLSDPSYQIQKHYLVELDKPIHPELIEGFKKGLYFSYEGITTRPVRINVITDRNVEVFLSEGRYHQIKRMFGHYRIKVIGLHRLAIGNLHLDATLKPGESRQLSEEEMANIFFTPHCKK